MTSSSRSSSSRSEKDAAAGTTPCISELEPLVKEEEEEGGTPLRVETVQSALDVLVHNAEGNLVYAQANLSNLHLTSITVLSSYKHLQRLSLDNNELHSLQPLRELHYLVYLSAANNKLGDDVFDDLTPSATTLERLNLSGNALTTLRGLKQLPFLIDFNAAHNQIETIDSNDLTALHSLTRLNLMSNHITRVDLDAFAGCNTVRRLDLSQNNIVNAQFVMHLAENLESLILDHNSVERLTGFEVLRSLVWLHLAHNRIADWKELHTLTDLMNLRQLTLEQNPFLETPITVVTISDTTQPPKSAIPPYNSEAKVAQDVDFVNSRVGRPQPESIHTSSVNDIASIRSGVSGYTGNVHNSSTSKNSTVASNVLLSTIAAPPARGLVHHIPAAPQELIGWNDDNQQELEQLSQYERNRFRVISMARQLSHLDSVPVAPEEIQRAMRLYKNRGGNGNSFAAGSAVRAVESQRKKGSNDTV
ncbi:uncharacterized protein TM35_000023520 [Trypanosoma theileri]|uniref:Leucine-rich repeat protein (LRRP) n=1 Tax=Trypanosoma theileri TaxID=67003 RepID=A0A1X0P7V7_9TRYP|nr:uncharacterized protein TM35_000023520 [Trypanosoma theileri]ORC93026.1 hypothetical protein TM35_000023520 [Trypanosoma theileri]